MANKGIGTAPCVAGAQYSSGNRTEHVVTQMTCYAVTQEKNGKLFDYKLLLNGLTVVSNIGGLNWIFFFKSYVTFTFLTMQLCTAKCTTQIADMRTLERSTM